MPADPADISSGIRRARVETWESAAIKARYPSARDGAAEPSEGFFDNAADGAAAVAQRGAIWGVERRGLVIEVAELVWVDPSLGLPTFTLIDPEQKVSGAALAARIELRLEDETSSFEVLV
jgi:hypothetical protein